MATLKNTVVVSAFPGTGKTHAFINSKTLIIDSDSSNFSWEEPGIRHPRFPENYMTHIKKFIGVVDYIMVSSHAEVRAALVDAGIDFTLVYPSVELKEEYLLRYRQRNSPQKFVDFIEKNWYKFHDDLKAQKNCRHLLLHSDLYISGCLGHEEGI